MLQLDGLDVLAVPAHNVDKKFHLPEDGWLGYVFTLGDTTFYHAGDTDFLDAMHGIQCDVAFIPCGGHYTMGVEDAARAAEACGADTLIPIHWGGAQRRPGRYRAAEGVVFGQCPDSREAGLVT
jgi:L-ascorbate metabolism protein UlaG (beta-lactamase superfamily)